MVRIALPLFVGFAAFVLAGRSASAQMTHVGTPLQSAGSSFYEGINLGWSVRNPHFSATFNGGGNAPPFGGFNPNAGLQGGFAFGGGGTSGGLTFGAAQGASRSFSSFVPSVTSMNGQPGFFSDSVQRPFVTGLVPVVGPGVVAYAPVVSGLSPAPQLAPLDAQLPWQAALGAQGLKPLNRGPDAKGPSGKGAAANAGAENRDDGGRGALIDPLPLTRAEREQQKSAEEAKKLASARGYFDKGVEAEQNGKLAVAKLYFEMAARRASGPLKDEIEQRLRTATRKP